MIEIGSVAPNFEAVDAKGTTFRLADLRGKRVVLYFFPKSFTTGCTMETKEFAELSPTLTAKGVQVVGVSVDAPETQSRFAAQCRADFPIVADPRKEIARAYGVLSFWGIANRVTFFLDENGVVRDVVASLRPGPHTSRAREHYLTGG